MHFEREKSNLLKIKIDADRVHHVSKLSSPHEQLTTARRIPRRIRGGFEADLIVVAVAQISRQHKQRAPAVDSSIIKLI